MPTETTIEAKMAAEGVGLPRALLLTTGQWCLEYDGIPPEGVLVDLTDPQTAFGVALKLDEWERSGGHMARWSRDLPISLTAKHDRNERVVARLQAMIARLTHIGQDHAIRRALGWTVEPGTLATLKPFGSKRHNAWTFQHAGLAMAFVPSERFSAAGVTNFAAGLVDGAVRAVPALDSITNPRAAIYAELCS